MRELPAGWASARLADVAEVRLGRQRSPKRATGDRMRPYLRAANVGWQGLKLDDVKQMDFSEAESTTYELRQGDLLLAEASGSAGEVGKPGQFRGEIADCCFQNTLIRVRLPAGMLPDFYEHFFRHEAMSRRFADGSRGVGIHHLGAATLSAWGTPIPPTAEQQRIVAAIDEAFSLLDAGDTALHNTRTRLKRMRESVLTAAVSGQLVPQDPTDTPADKLLADLGALATPDPGELPAAPQSWAWARLGDLAEVVGGVTKDAKRQEDSGNVEVPYLRVANVQRGYLDLTTIATIRVPTAKAAQLALRPGDVLFNEGGDRDKLGRGWVWDGQIPGCIHQNHVYRARLADGIEPKFVSWWGNTFGRGWFELHGKQTTNLASINLTTLKSFPVPVPPPEEQARIVAEVERQLSFIEAAERAVDVGVKRSAGLRRSVLKAAFEGRLVEQNPADEPASVLLERIAAERAAAAPARRAPRRVRGKVEAS